MQGTLYIVATPIGNLEDITLRAIRVLSSVDVILAEDTRVTGKILNSINTGDKRESGVSSKLISYHQHSGEDKKLMILKMLTEGKNMALVTDAGTPGISDPGNELIAYLYEKNPQISFIPIPGPSAITASLSVCGFDINRLVFIGFMPKRKKNKLIKWLKEGNITFAYYDSPHRVIKNLLEIEKYFGKNTKVFIARELTKVYETIYRGEIEAVLKDLQKKPVKGELVVVIGR